MACAHVRQIMYGHKLPCAHPNCPNGVDAPYWNVALEKPLRAVDYETMTPAFVTMNVRSFVRFKRTWKDGHVDYAWKDVTI